MNCNKTNQNARTLNLSTSDVLNIGYPLQEITILPTMKKIIRNVMQQNYTPILMKSIYRVIDNLIKTENIFDKIPLTNKSVAVVINAEEIDPRLVQELNTHYQIIDAEHIGPLSYFNELLTYGKTLSFPDNDFFHLLLKCLYTVNTRIGAEQKVFTKLNNWEYSNQNFLDLMKRLIIAKAFTIIVNGTLYEISYTSNGRVIIDGNEIVTLSDLQTKIPYVITTLYNSKPQTLQ